VSWLAIQSMDIDCGIHLKSIARNMIFDKSRLLDKSLSLYIQDNMVSTDNSQDEHNIKNNKINIIEDIQNNCLKLQKLLDSNIQEKVNQRVVQ